MKRTFESVGTIAVVLAALVGGTGAFFSDTEQSTGNTFAAGAIDLTIDNDSYYNRNRCAIDANDIDTDQNVTEYLWQGQAAYPVPGTDCETSFPASDLDNGLLFFNFTDLKPDDEGEDTISIHGGTNDAFACIDIVLTSNDDKSSNEPELGSGDDQEDVNNTWDGELAQNIQMIWWADDGDNVLEANENVISDGVQTITDLASTSGPFSVALADSENNVWDEENLPGIIPAGETYYIGKAWCYGELTPAPVPEGQGVNPSVNPGITCDGTGLGNETQTDGLTLDVAFRAIQARNNEAFVCGEQETRTAKLTVIKQVVNDNGGNNVVADFQLFADNGIIPLPVTSGVENEVVTGNYTITETGIAGYQASFSGDCDASGQITLAEGDDKTCVITNNDLTANITLVKNVINNNGGVATAASAWGLRIDGVIVPNNTSVAVTSNVPHAITEDGRAGYTFVSITGNAKCPAVLGGTATLDEGEAITCTITNDDNAQAQALFSDNFGTGNTDDSFDEAPTWTEGGAGAAKRNSAGGGDESISDGDGGRKAAMVGPDGYICRTINAAGFQSMNLAYSWRGDSQAEVGDNGIVEYATGGTCAAPTGLTTLATHSLTTTTWQSNSVPLPGSLNNTSFLLRYRVSSNAADEDFRIDAVALTGLTI